MNSDVKTLRESHLYVSNPPGHKSDSWKSESCSSSLPAQAQPQPPATKSHPFLPGHSVFGLPRSYSCPCPSSIAANRWPPWILILHFRTRGRIGIGSVPWRGCLLWFLGLLRRWTRLRCLLLRLESVSLVFLQPTGWLMDSHRKSSSL